MLSVSSYCIVQHCAVNEAGDKKVEEEDNSTENEEEIEK